MNDRVNAQVEQYLLLGVEKYSLNKVDFKTGHTSIMEQGVCTDMEYNQGDDTVMLNKIYAICDRVLERISNARLNAKKYFEISVTLGYSIAKQGTIIEVEAHVPTLGTLLIAKI
jgi:hypothetical protein